MPVGHPASLHNDPKPSRRVSNAERGYSQLSTFIALGIFTGLIYSMVALGYTLVYGTLRLINFAHSEVFMSGAFAGYFLLNAFVGTNAAPPSGVRSVLWVCAGTAIAAAVGSIVAVLIERFVYRPLRRRGAPPLTYLVAAIGASYFLQNFAGKEFGRYPTSGFPVPYSNGPAFTVLGATVTLYDVIVLIAAAVLLVIVDLVVNKTKVGRGIRAISQDAQTASLMGVNVNRTISFTFALGGALGGAAGFIFALSNGVSPSMGFIPGLYAFAAAVIGGIGNIRGAMLGGLALGIAETVPIYWVHQVWLEEPIAFGLLIVLLIFRPTGLLGERVGRTA